LIGEARFRVKTEIKLFYNILELSSFELLLTKMGLYVMQVKVDE
jgi:hypothetical protein